ncbi:SDR family oxidoreductase [Paraburkholderia sp. BL10I2N1]|uniref:SDR family NAD(P)-dependent oxidoreductase n=1 Tax=Paraburkholderia sp. BL10I2N1 TaxID=1938796 RepID=UPI00105CDFDD|nr:SDR family oxidoreductase [Paraburkholderia sp. BL10I2N1]TDN61930.1 NAD(P)-dependent dehydrogenase (short-subunit alcohol dehydrogenase family) [Paraburkholderia sp. BL10I2N1]
MLDNITNMFRLDGRTVLVTGASSGLGRHFTFSLARAGATVIVAARRTGQLDDLVNEIGRLGCNAFAVPLDVRDTASVTTCFDMIAQNHGVPDVIVNSAGLTLTKPLLQHTEDDWGMVVDTNLGGTWRVAQEGARRMVAAGKGGSIVNIASILGERVAGGVAPYAISKAGLIQATKSMALELARYRIRANAILPGYIATDLNREFLASEAGDRLRGRIPSRAFGQPEHLDGALLLLASDASIHMTGAVLAVDGGHLVGSL